jgi:DHA2 family multidrug resistance protein
VFYINVPIGILAFLGVLAFVADTRRDRSAPFDMFGFAFLGLAVGALQICLDRGEQKDWFGSPEIVLEALLAIIGLWVFTVHTLTARRPFLNPALLRDRNFVAGTVLMFLSGAVMYGVLALLPPMLSLLDYPVVTTGLMLAPRGITTMIFMMIVGRLIGRIDIRLILLCGLVLTGISLWEMTGYSPTMDWRPVVIAGFVQGAGLGFIFVPLSTAAFSTLPAALRTEGSSVFSLLRNMGGSIGISVAETLFDRGVQVSHADLSQDVSPFNPALHGPAMQNFWSLNSSSGLSALDQLVNFQAAMIAYVDLFKLMMIVCFLAIPLVLLVRPVKHPATAALPME